MFVAVSRHKHLFLAPIVAVGVAPLQVHKVIYENRSISRERNKEML